MTEFTAGFELEVLASAASNRRFRRKALRVLNDYSFSDPASGWIWSMIEELGSEDRLTGLVVGHQASRDFEDDDEKLSHIRFAKEVLTHEVGAAGISLDRLQQFALDGRMRSGMEKALSLMAKGKTEDARALLAKATRDQLSLVYTGGDWRGEFEARMESRRLPPEDLIKVPLRFIPGIDRLTNGGIESQTVNLIVGTTGRGKCLGPNTPVIKSTGERVLAKDVVTGDRLLGPDGTSRTVLGTTSGFEQMYRVVPIKGEPWICNGPHQLTLVDSASGEVYEVAVEDLPKMGKNRRRLAKLFSVGVESFEGEARAEDLPVDPYFLGVWFGDGSKRVDPDVTGLHSLNSVHITNPDPEIKKACLELAQDLELKLTESFNSCGCPAFRLSRTSGKESNHLLDSMRSLVGAGLVIPESYLTAEREVRLQFLAGFLDTDGYLKSDGCGFEIVQKRKDWADAILFVARSLGLRATVRKKYVKGYDHPFYRIFIVGRTDQIPTRIPRKQASPRRQIKDALRTGFSIEPIGPGEYVGFEVDGDHRFLLGDFTVTHNSIFGANVAFWAAFSGYRTIYISTEMSRRLVNTRLDSRWLAIAYDRIKEYDFTDDELELIEARMAKTSKLIGKLLVYDIPVSRCNMEAVEQIIDDVEDEWGTPAVLVFDSADHLTPRERVNSRRDKESAAYWEFKSLCHERNLVGWSTSHAPKDMVNKIATAENVGESYDKARICDSMFTLNQNKADREQGILKLYVAKNRQGPAGRMLHLQGDFARMFLQEDENYVEDSGDDDDDDE